MTTHAYNRPWRVAEEDRTLTAELAKSLGVPRLVAHLLTTRGIAAASEGEKFLNPSLDQLTDPFLLTDMEPAVERIAAARARNERVLVFGDYDADGIAGTAILVNALRRYGVEDCTCAMPSRLIEGYGISAEHVKAAARDGVRLIITVDNGVNAREAGTTARRLGIDLLVTDHHQLEGELPEAVAVVNPKREPQDHPSWHAAGAGVAFHLGRALTGQVDDLDLVTLGTVADIVPLRQENRVLVALGLRDLMQRRRTGIVELAKVAGTNIEEITAEKIAFQLAPRLNAAGRLGDSLGPLQLLMTDSVAEAARIAGELDRANDERRSIEKIIFDQTVEEVEATLWGERHSIVLARRGWHPGVIGVVASRLVAAYGRPVVLIAIDEEGVARGSARSSGDFDMAAALGACKDHLVRFGGHAAAAGLTLSEGNLEAFREAFEQEAARRFRAGEAAPPLDVDALVSFSEIDPQLVKGLARLEPFGNMNPAPILATCGVTVLPHSFRELRGGHARLMVQQGTKLFEAVGWNMLSFIQEKVGSHPIDIAFTPQFSTWRGETTVQLVLKDIHV